MKKVGTRELKNRLSAYLRRVRRGEKLIVTDRGVPVAEIGPVQPETPRSPQKALQEILQDLAAQGILRLGTQEFIPVKPIPSRGKSASEMIIEDRR